MSGRRAVGSRTMVAAPAPELAGGGGVRIATAALTPDSAYFAGAPSVVVPYPPGSVHGLVRASICRDDETVCRQVTVRL